MYIKTIPATQTDPEDRELIMDSDDEAVDIIVESIADNGFLEEIYHGTDFYTEESIELKTSEYLSNDKIDMINDMLMDCDEWSECQLNYILNNLQTIVLEPKK